MNYLPAIRLASIHPYLQPASMIRGCLGLYPARTQSRCSGFPLENIRHLPEAAVGCSAGPWLWRQEEAWPGLAAISACPSRPPCLKCRAVEVEVCLASPFFDVGDFFPSYAQREGSSAVEGGVCVRSRGHHRAVFPAWCCHLLLLCSSCVEDTESNSPVSSSTRFSQVQGMEGSLGCGRQGHLHEARGLAGLCCRRGAGCLAAIHRQPFYPF